MCYEFDIPNQKLPEGITNLSRDKGLYIIRVLLVIEKNPCVRATARSKSFMNVLLEDDVNLLVSCMFSIFQL